MCIRDRPSAAQLHGPYGNPSIQAPSCSPTPQPCHERPSCNRSGCRRDTFRTSPEHLPCTSNSADLFGSECDETRGSSCNWPPPAGLLCLARSRESSPCIADTRWPVHASWPSPRSRGSSRKSSVRSAGIPPNAEMCIRDSYKPTSVEARRFKELETTLKSEPIEYDGKHPYYSKKHFPNCKPNDLSVLDD